MRANARTRGTKKARQPVSAPAGARAYLMRANVALAPSGLKSSSLCLSMCCSALDCRWIINRRCAPRGAREAQPLRRAAPSACGAHGMPGGGREVPQPPPCAHSVPAHARKPRRPPFAPTHLARAAAHECARASPPAAPTPPPALVGASLRAPSRPSSPAPAPTAWEQPLARPLALRAPAHACAPTRVRARAAAGRLLGFATTNGCVHFESVVRAPSGTVINKFIHIRRHTGTTDLI